MSETAFKVKDGTATYTLRTLDSDTADYYGCPGSDTMLIGHLGHMIGSVKIVTGKAVRVPGWSSRKGTLAVFTPWNGQGESLKGWIGL